MRTPAQRTADDDAVGWKGLKGIEMARDNRCGAGYCSLGITSEMVAECQSKKGDSWDGLCIYQNGNRVVDGQRRVQLSCCKSGCSMKAAWYAQWNGRCAYQESEGEYADPEMDDGRRLIQEPLFVV